MSSRIGLWLSSRRSVSPRVPTVEYARSERSWAKSSQAARNSRLSSARASGSRRCHAGSSLKNVNLAKVRSGTAAMVVLAVVLLWAAATPGRSPAEARQHVPTRGVGTSGSASASDRPTVAARDSARITIAVVPSSVSLADLAGIRGMGVGLLSAGIGDVPAEQTYLDVSQGARTSGSLYDQPLPHIEPRVSHGTPSILGPQWQAIRERADSAPANLVPGLLGSTLLDRHIMVEARGGARDAALTLVDENGKLGYAGSACLDCTTVEVESASVGALRRLAGSVSGDDLLIAMGRPPPASNHALALGIAGRGFDGTLTSDSTRMRGYVLSTDLGPTILQRLGIPKPSEMTGEPIRTDGAVDASYVQDLQDRLAEIGPRRAPVIGISVLIWVVLTILAAVAFRRAGLRVALTVLAASLALVPAVLLLCAALDPSELAERLIVGIGCPLGATLTLWLAPGMRGLAVCAAASVIACAVDVVAGSHLTELSLIGPNPIEGVRFYGIGNELEATLAALVPIGTGAALAGWAPRASAGGAAVAFVITALAAVAAFAPGSFGADVGAAIGIPVGAAVAIGICLGVRRTGWIWVIVAPIAAVAALIAIDLATGGNAHLTRSVLDAGGLGNLGDVFQRRLELSAHSFARYAQNVVFWIVIALIVAGVAQWRRIEGWFGARRAAWAGLLGAVGATLAGTLANDSGALLLMIGAVLCAATVGVAWATHGERHSPPLWRPAGPVT